MASLVSDSNGHRRIQWKAADGSRKQIRLGAVEKRTAERIRIKIEALISAVATRIQPDEEITRWVGELSDQLHDRLAGVGLVPPRQYETLKSFFDNFVARNPDWGKNTRRNVDQARKWFFQHFAETQALRSVTKAHADEFHAFLRRSLKSGNTVSTVMKKVKQAFADAAEREVIPSNPFRHIKSPIRSNPERMEFVRPEWTAPILKACPDLEWKIIFLMARYAGVRVPSELQSFKWDDILWQQGRIRIHDAKRSRPGKPVIRIIPMFAELRPVLAEAYEKRNDESIYVCPRAREGSTNLRTQMHRIIKRAGLKPWQRTFQNMRSTRETELAEHFSMHVVTRWIGNTDSVAVQHYLQVTNEHFDRAVKEHFDADGFDIDIDAMFEEAAQNRAHTQQDSQEPEMTEADNEKPQAPEGSGTCGQNRCKSLSDNDLRVPPRGVEPLFIG